MSAEVFRTTWGWCGGHGVGEIVDTLVLYEGRDDDVITRLLASCVLQGQQQAFKKDSDSLEGLGRPDIDN
jgi:hypothetical protein